MSRLNLRHERVIEAKLSGLSINQMVDALGYTYSGICHILTVPYVRQRLAEAEAEALRPLLDKARADVDGCLDVLKEITLNTKASNRDRITAATQIIKIFFQCKDVVETQTRLAHLESLVPSLTTSSDSDPDDSPAELDQAS